MEELDKYFSEQYDTKIQYASIEAGIKAHAEEYSFNIESELFNQLTKEQQTLWRKEIEQAVISGGYNGLDLARDPRYKENHEVKEVDLEEELKNLIGNVGQCDRKLAKHFFELGLKAQSKITPLQQQRISVMKMEFWTGLQTFNESEMTLSDAYNKGIEDVLEELNLAQKGE